MRELRRFFNEKWLELIIAGVCLPFVGAAFAVWLANRPLVMLSAAVAIVLGVAVYLRLREWRAQRRRPLIGEEEAFKLPRRGVIFTLGLRSANPDSVVYLVMEKLKPEFVGFLGTHDTDKGKLVEKLCGAHKLQEGQYKTESWDPLTILDGKVKAGLVIDWMLSKGLSERDIVLDITGGTATMSVAAFMAAEERRIDCQYIKSEYDENKNQFIQGSQRPILVTHYTLPDPATQSQ